MNLVAVRGFLGPKIVTVGFGPAPVPSATTPQGTGGSKQREPRRRPKKQPNYEEEVALMLVLIEADSIL